jgi:hypothetical protein
LHAYVWLVEHRYGIFVGVVSIARDSEGDKKVETDLVGRVMLLEQKFRSVSGRINALEMRITGGAVDAYGGVPQAAPDGGSPDDSLEFVPADVGRDNLLADVIRLQGRIAELEMALEKSSKKQSMVITAGMFSFDVTGLIVGFLMIAGGMLLATGNFELLKNPLLVLMGGVAILMWVAYKSLSR